MAWKINDILRVAHLVLLLKVSISIFTFTLATSFETNLQSDFSEKIHQISSYS